MATNGSEMSRLPLAKKFFLLWQWNIFIIKSRRSLAKIRAILFPIREYLKLFPLNLAGLHWFRVFGSLGRIYLQKCANFSTPTAYRFAGRVTGKLFSLSFVYCGSAFHLRAVFDNDQEFSCLRNRAIWTIIALSQTGLSNCTLKNFPFREQIISNGVIPQNRISDVWNVVRFLRVHVKNAVNAHKPEKRSTRQ